MSFSYAELETKLGEIDQARAISYSHVSQMSNPIVRYNYGSISRIHMSM